MTTYPCPFCGGQADLDAGCSGCGRPPFPDAAEVVRLGARAGELLVEVEAARAELDEARSKYQAAVQRLNAVRAQRNMLAARVSQAVEMARRALSEAAAASVRPMPAPPQPPIRPVLVPGPGGPAVHGPAAVPPAAAPAAEASPRTVQNLLFILGGLLLGSAAIVFAAVAWASFGVLGRAAILATVTVVTLAVPPLALARGLRSTAETFAALGLLLVLLDGYAAWYVNLAGLADTTTPSTYAGLVFGVTAVVAGGYALATGLRGPRFAALLAVQPVLPLLAADRSFEATGWTLTFVAVAALDVLLARTVEKAAWVGAGIAVATAAPLGLLALSTVDGVTGALGAGGAMLALAAVIVAAGLAHRTTAHVGTAVAVGIVALVAVRILAEVLPDHRAIAFACVPVLLALAATVLPARVRAGARVGAYVVAGTTAVPYAYAALFAAGSAVDAALPAWHGPASTLARIFSWQVAAALLPVAAAVFVLTRSRLVVWPTLVLLALAVPGTFDAPLPVVSVLDFAVLAALTVTALRWSTRPAPTPVVGLAAPSPATPLQEPSPVADRARTAIPAGWWAATALPVVAAHAVLVGLDTPLATLLTMAGLTVICAVFAARSGSARFAAPGITIGLAGLPLLAAAAVRLATNGEAWSVPAPMFGAAGGLALATVLATVALGRFARTRNGMGTPQGTPAAPHGVTGTAQGGISAAQGEVGAAQSGIGAVQGAPEAPFGGIGAAQGTSEAQHGGVGPAYGGIGAGQGTTGVGPDGSGGVGWAGVLGVALGGLGVTLAAVGLSVADGGRLPFGVFAAGVILAVWFAATGAAGWGRVRDGGPAAGGTAGAWLVTAVLPGVIPATVVLIAVVPAVFETLVRPYRWLGAVWQGAPGGVGLDPGGRWWAGEAQAFGPGPAAAALGLVAVLAVLVARRTRTAVWTLAGAPLTMAVVLGCLAAEAPWPVVPAVTLAGGLGTALAAALVRPGARAMRVNVGAFTCWFTAGAGFAGCLATRPATLAALAAVLVTGAVVGVAGRTAAARTAGWLVGAVSAGWLAFASARAAELPLRWAGYWVLLAAAAVLAASVVVRRLRPAATGVQDGGAQVVPGHDGASPAAASQTGAAQAEATHAWTPPSAPMHEGPTHEGATQAGIAQTEAAAAGAAAAAIHAGAAQTEAVQAAPAGAGAGAAQGGWTQGGVGQVRDGQGRNARAWEGLVLEVVAHATAVVAFLLTSGDLAAMAGISSLWGLALGLRALTGGPRVAFAGVAGAAQLVAYWLVLASNEVALLEAYTLPAGAVAAGVGWYATRKRAVVGQRPLGSWVAFGPALLAAFGPSLASVLVVEGEPVRRLLLGTGALVVVVVGAVRRLQAPAVTGGLVLTVVALHEIAVYWDLLPRWAPLAVAGLVLVALATTYERRIRDVRRIRDAVTRMR
ncbi:SCO7613 C-terminal domain-containing membrane protein [Dactylosporangium maewongense]|uniref:SCO7613 C-terminal domain-containing membrane protein n=1 Tax=Dactylosporangium maewongense TaxID=634393 RepID=UPI0031D58E54